MKQYSGIAYCPNDGDFAWRLIERTNGEVAVYRGMSPNENVYYNGTNSETPYIIVQCPKCHIQFTVNV